MTLLRRHTLLSVTGISALLTGLISYWKLDESSGNAIDSHGSNDGTVVGATQGAAGKVGTSYDFDGGNDQINFGSPIVPATGEFTVSLWVKSPTLAGSRGLFGQYYDVVGERFYATFRATAAFIQIGGTSLIYSNTFLVDTWYYLTFTRDSSNLVRIYVDGDLKNSGTLSSNVDQQNLTIGAYREGATNVFWRGNIDGFGIWSRALTADEITNLHNSGNGLAFPF